MSTLSLSLSLSLARSLARSRVRKLSLNTHTHTHTHTHAHTHTRSIARLRGSPLSLAYFLTLYMSVTMSKMHQALSHGETFPLPLLSLPIHHPSHAIVTRTPVSRVFLPSLGGKSRRGVPPFQGLFPLPLLSLPPLSPASTFLTPPPPPLGSAELILGLTFSRLLGCKAC